jgi:hypothetical protein
MYGYKFTLTECSTPNYAHHRCDHTKPVDFYYVPVQRIAYYADSNGEASDHPCYEVAYAEFYEPAEIVFDSREALELWITAEFAAGKVIKFEKIWEPHALKEEA